MTDTAPSDVARSNRQSTTRSPQPVPVRRVRKAYEQVADQLRELIVSGQLKPDQRLPNEVALAEDFGVSRPTVREALRSLAAQNLIRTAKGAAGGSFVASPTVDNISSFVSSSVALLSQSSPPEVSLDELLEARELLEVPAARLAALRHGEADVAELRAWVPEQPLELPTEEQFAMNRNFHASLVAAAGNTLLTIAAQPVFNVLQTNLRRSRLGRKYHLDINHDHRRIVEAVERGDEQAAAEEMRAHLAYLRPRYERGWREARKG